MSFFFHKTLNVHHVIIRWIPPLLALLFVVYFSYILYFWFRMYNDVWILKFIAWGIVVCTVGTRISFRTTSFPGRSVKQVDGQKQSNNNNKIIIIMFTISQIKDHIFSGLMWTKKKELEEYHWVPLIYSVKC